ncbi:hypothetical protein MVLG_05403 [Microbotryum lychnidis-dioicae p1A1 Lamole]|uniref:PABS domain-containing protein n=1 Tax=Microbotryum lychnidis-dioicae (strain p1A1 Lamole / MvSl-1064) TaxID=683840 RepID=U5HE55_USTV1|nr:hypothetical protein MVLG_05403 [Microbotryum lychnidis-dioicae p1A1 Lamole]|eukprot:KDE04110.1 hypothetical protein MVLG_05403 [Microbotryum lychnidis-dioicae p1A1 Lamole]
MLRASWRMGLVNDLKTVKGPWSALATLAGAMGIALALESSSLGSFNNRWLPYTGIYPTLVPETTVMNIHSLALILIVLVPTLRRQVDPPNGLSTSSISTKSSVVLVCLTASALLASIFSSPTCHLKPYLPSFFCSKPIAIGPVRILASQQSITGRVVVGETMVHNLTLRYLRVDHSLLGGLWMMPAKQDMATGRPSRSAVDDVEAELRRAESIYSTFILQELVRLARPPRITGGVQEEKALVIGLGAGLIARSLEQHGIVTSLVEIDPVVYQYARDYYGVKNMRGEIALEDAIGFLSRKQVQETYDYIIHDVFTGGTVPPSLFTMEAWALVKSALTPDGLVAINFAGTVDSPTSHVVLSTILASFYHCIVLGDGGLTRSTSGFSNLAIFCSAQPGRKVVLRPAVASDYLEWPSPNLRRKILGNFQDFVQDLHELVPRNKLEDVLRGKKGRRRLKDLQRGSAELHWGLMNGVLPLEVWDMY